MTKIEAAIKIGENYSRSLSVLRLMTKNEYDPKLLDVEIHEAMFKSQIIESMTGFKCLYGLTNPRPFDENNWAYRLCKLSEEWKHSEEGVKEKATELQNEFDELLFQICGVATGQIEMAQ